MSAFTPINQCSSSGSEKSESDQDHDHDQGLSPASSVVDQLHKTEVETEQVINHDSRTIVFDMIITAEAEDVLDLSEVLQTNNDINVGQQLPPGELTLRNEQHHPECEDDAVESQDEMDSQEDTEEVPGPPATQTQVSLGKKLTKREISKQNTKRRKLENQAKKDKKAAEAAEKKAKKEAMQNSKKRAVSGGTKAKPKKPKLSKKAVATMTESQQMTSQEAASESDATMEDQVAIEEATRKKKAAQPYSFEEMEKVTNWLLNGRGLNAANWASLTDAKTLNMPHRSGIAIHKELTRVIREVLVKNYKRECDIMEDGQDNIGEKGTAVGQTETFTSPTMEDSEDVKMAGIEMPDQVDESEGVEA